MMAQFMPLTDPTNGMATPLTALLPPDPEGTVSESQDFVIPDVVVAQATAGCSVPPRLYLTPEALSFASPTPGRRVDNLTGGESLASNVGLPATEAPSAMPSEHGKQM